MFIAFVMATCCCVLPIIQCYNILLLPYMVGSHLMQAVAVGEELVRNGHRVYIVLHNSTRLAPQDSQSGLVQVRYYTGDGTHCWSNPEFKSLLMTWGEHTIAQKISVLAYAFKKECEDTVDNDALYRQLNDLALDFALVDGVAMLRCKVLIPHALNIPYGSISTFLPTSELQLVLQMPFVAPTPMAITGYYAETSFGRRLTQTLQQTLTWSAMRWWSERGAYFDRARERRPFSSLDALVARTSVWFVDADPVVDVAYVLPPNVITVGGLTARPARELPPKFRQWIEAELSAQLDG